MRNKRLLFKSTMLWYFVIVAELNKTDGTNDISAAASVSFIHDSGVRSTKGLMSESHKRKLELELPLPEGTIRSLTWEHLYSHLLKERGFCSPWST